MGLQVTCTDGHIIVTDGGKIVKTKLYGGWQDEISKTLKAAKADYVESVDQFPHAVLIFPLKHKLIR